MRRRRVLLTVAAKDEYGNFETTVDDGVVIFKTKGEISDEEIRRFYCIHVKFEKSKEALAEVCPYHGPGRLKEKWDTVGKPKYEAKKLKEEEKAQKKERKEARKMHDRENGCVVL